FCTRPARACQMDHTQPYDPNGPPGQTNTDNLACLCQHHHNLKTHTNWAYTMLEPGVYLWRSPHGYQYLRDHTGTRDVTPPPVPGPG
ncbi:MAG: endonuclease, partial [Marmoricola sp.]|nr:endonuclease [Marmoricola sp.]